MNKRTKCNGVSASLVFFCDKIKQQKANTTILNQNMNFYCFSVNMIIFDNAHLTMFVFDDEVFRFSDGVDKVKIFHHIEFMLWNIFTDRPTLKTYT